MADANGKATAGGAGYRDMEQNHTNEVGDSHVMDMRNGSISRGHPSLAESFANSPHGNEQAGGGRHSGSGTESVRFNFFRCWEWHSAWRSAWSHSKFYRPRSLLLRQLLAEVIGTYILVFGGCASAIVDKKNNEGVIAGQVTHLGVSIAFGIVVMIMIYSVGHISGAHINPAVSVAFATVRHFPWHIVPLYVVAQIAGATLSAGTLRLILGDVAHLGATLPAGSDWQSFAMEIVITYILMFVVLSVATDHRAIGDMAGLAIGSTVGLNAIYAGPISGASMNPARSIGPAIVATKFTALWVYILGPGLGALLGAWSYNIIKGPGPTPAELEARAAKNTA